MSEARILVVEDEKIVAFDLVRRLERFGYTVPALVATGAEAIQQSADLRPDLVLMDIKLKGDMDGIEAAQEIQSRLGIRVVYLTAFADSDTLVRTRDTNASGFLTKPFDDAELQATLDLALRDWKVAPES